MFFSNNPYFALQIVCSSQITPIWLYKMPNKLICLLLTIIYWCFQIASQWFISTDLVFIISTLSVVSIAFYTSQYTKWWLWETLELAVPHSGLCDTVLYSQSETSLQLTARSKNSPKQPIDDSQERLTAKAIRFLYHWSTAIGRWLCSGGAMHYSQHYHTHWLSGPQKQLRLRGNT